MGVVLSERTASGKALNAVRQLGLGRRLVNVGAARVVEKVLFCLNSGRKRASDGQKLGFWRWFGAGLAHCGRRRGSLAFNGGPVAGQETGGGVG